MTMPILSDTAHLAARTMVLRNELTAVLQACRDQALACVPLRGIALAEQLYGEGALRPAGDIDLLVRRQDLPAMTALLTALGYKPLEHHEGFAEIFSYTLAFVKDRHGWVVVEPHWTLAYPPFADTLDMETVWNRCRRGCVAGVETLLLGNEDLLVHLCAHLLHHGSEAPSLWWQELDLLIRQTGPSLNWNTTAEIAEQSGQSALVLHVLQTLRNRFHSPIPGSTLARLEVARPQTALSRLLTHAPALDGREEFAQLVSLRGARPKLRYALGLVFPSPSYMRTRYTVHHPVRLGMAYASRLFRIGWEGLRWTLALAGAARATRNPASR